MEKTNRREFLKSTAATGSQATLDPVAIARRHTIVREIPTPVFFEGMMLGNSDVGLCVTVRPDVLGLHIGKKTPGTSVSARTMSPT